MLKKLKPKNEKILVHNPATKRALPIEGKEVEMSPYWRRMIKCGDVVEVSPDKKEVTPAKALEKNKK